jgi:tripartite-type tricarboxylate transporter receptor subunit TctC
MRCYKRILLFVFVFACAATEVTAQPYPSRPISMIVPFAAGAPVDTVGRLIADRMAVSLGQPIILENVSGAAGGIAVARAARAAPDGYTLSLGNISSHVLNGAVSPQPFDALKDFEPVALLASNPQLILSKNALPAHDLKELIAWLKANPDKATAGTGGNGGVSHVAGLFFEKQTGTRFQFVSYRGTNLAQQDLIGGQIDLLFDQAVSALTNVRAGKMRAYAVTSEKRVAFAPEIPTADEAGLPDFHMSVWNAIWVPKGTPKEIVAKLNGAVREALASSSVRNHLDELGLSVPPIEQRTPDALGAFHRAEVAKWWPIVKAANGKME